MATRTHLKSVRRGAEAIARWREENSNARLDLSGAKFTGADLHGADLHGADLGEANLSGANLHGADLGEANLSGADLHGADFGEANLSGANLDETNFGRTDLTYANLSGAVLGRADLSEAHLSEADLSRANLSGANLKKTDLSEANFCKARLDWSDLREASLSGANLSWAILSRANLRGATLREANLRGANLGDTSLSKADLSKAYLGRANLSEADLSGADLGEAVFEMTVLNACNLSEMLGLDTVIHGSRSFIDIHTIINAKGKIPEVFLRGCGVPEEWITHIPSILGATQPIQFYSCFISYSHADKPFARRLHDALQGRGIRCWLDEHQLLPGDDPHEQIDRGIRLWDKVLLCASKASLTSWWVDKEIAAAFKKEQQLMKERGKKTLALIPLDLDGFLFSDECHNPKATEVQERIAAKFAGWDKDNALFEREFDRLIKALQTNDTGREASPPARL